ncbi:MAG: hypothetical protein P8L79_16600 [Rhodospirillaceae bacterium]|nr:hypothetical protein [Rhodospirillaceae bacterium]
MINAAIDYHAYDSLVQLSGPFMNCADPGHHFVGYAKCLDSVTANPERLAVSSDSHAHADRLAAFLAA